MFTKIDRISIEVTKNCNFNCSYCHQIHDERLLDDDVLSGAISFINMSSFINKEFLDITPAGGEATYDIYRLLSFFSRVKREVVVKNKRFALLSNMSDLDLVLSLLRDGTIDRERVGFSWDGKYHCETRINGFDNEYFMSCIRKIGSSEFAKDINVQHAITRKTIPHLYDNISFLVDSGLRNINIYLINGEKYDEDMVKEYSLQLGKIADLFIDRYVNDRDRLRFFMFQKCFRDNVFRAKESMDSVTMCRKIGKALHITIDGSIYPCIYFGDHNLMRLGDIYNGLDPERIKSFAEEYNKPAKCIIDNNCMNRQCLSCPAVNYRVRGSFNNRDIDHCEMYSVGTYWFGYIIEKLKDCITPLALKNFWGRVDEPT